MLVVLVAVSPCKEEVVTSQAGINAAVEPAAPSLLALALLVAPSSFNRWEALSVVRANLAVVVVVLPALVVLLLLLVVVVVVVVLLVLLVVPFLPGVGSRDVLGPNDRTCRTLLLCALGNASLDRMGRSRTQT